MGLRIVNLEDFRKLPNQTLYSKYSPCFFDGLMIKVETWEHDFVTQGLIGNIEASESSEYFDKLHEAQETGCGLNLDFDFAGRDGLFEDNQLFAVYEKKDVINLIERLGVCV